VRLVADHLGEYTSLTAASVAVAQQVGVGHETVRRWVVQSQVDGGQREDVTTEEKHCLEQAVQRRNQGRRAAAGTYSVQG
jgi:transposase